MSETAPPLMNEALQRRLRAIAARLAAEYDGVFSHETVEAVVADSIERLIPITVTAHLPVLIERFARQRLSHAPGSYRRRRCAEIGVRRAWPGL
jgi:hypothetical protein